MKISFDGTWDSAFKTSPYRLRFELGGEVFGCDSAPIPRFVQALTRSRAIRDSVFADAHRLCAFVVSDANPSNDMLAPATDGFEALSNLGFSSVPVMEWRAPRYPYESGEQAEDCIWRAFDVTSDIASQDALLWCSLAYEMPVKPKAPVASYLADFERGVLLHIYDDRGMDVSALTASALMPVYRAFDPWLLDYDRDRMKTAFVGA